MYLLRIREGLREQELETKGSVVRFPSFFFSCHCNPRTKIRCCFQQSTAAVHNCASASPCGALVLRPAVGWQPGLEGVEALCADMKRLENDVALRKQSERGPGAACKALVSQTLRGKPLLDHEIGIVEMYITLCTKDKCFISLLFTCV